MSFDHADEYVFGHLHTYQTSRALQSVSKIISAPTVVDQNRQHKSHRSNQYVRRPSCFTRVPWVSFNLQSHDLECVSTKSVCVYEAKSSRISSRVVEFSKSFLPIASRRSQSLPVMLLAVEVSYRDVIEPCGQVKVELVLLRRQKGEYSL